jgi:hypothetical protein
VPTPLFVLTLLRPVSEKQQGATEWTERSCFPRKDP